MGWRGVKSWLWGSLVLSEHLLLRSLCPILQGPARLGRVGFLGGVPVARPLSHRFLGAPSDVLVSPGVVGLGWEQVVGGNPCHG